MVKSVSRARKKVKKNISEGIAFVHASFNNTIITITDRQGNAYRGLLRAALVLKALGKVLRLQLKLLLKMRAKLQLNAALKI